MTVVKRISLAGVPLHVVVYFATFRFTFDKIIFYVIPFCGNTKMWVAHTPVGFSFQAGLQSVVLRVQ